MPLRRSASSREPKPTAYTHCMVPLKPPQRVLGRVAVVVDTLRDLGVCRLEEGRRAPGGDQEALAADDTDQVVVLEQLVRHARHCK